MYTGVCIIQLLRCRGEQYDMASTRSKIGPFNRLIYSYDTARQKLVRMPEGNCLGTFSDTPTTCATPWSDRTAAATKYGIVAIYY